MHHFVEEIIQLVSSELERPLEIHGPTLQNP